MIDSAFSTLNHDFPFKSLQDDLTADWQYEYLEDQIANIAIKREATSMHQLAEWGMRALQSSFPSLKDSLAYEECGEWRIMFGCSFHLFNLQSRLVGINQITSVYSLTLDIDENSEFLG